MNIEHGMSNYEVSTPQSFLVQYSQTIYYEIKFHLHRPPDTDSFCL
jgi:hypothetical protein